MTENGTHNGQEVHCGDGSARCLLWTLFFFSFDDFINNFVHCLWAPVGENVTPTPSSPIKLIPVVSLLSLSSDDPTDV